MKRAKRIISLLLSVVLTLSLCVPALAAQTFTINGVTVSTSSSTALSNCSNYADQILTKIRKLRLKNC